MNPSSETYAFWYKFIVLSASLPYCPITMLKLMPELTTGFGSEIGLKVLNNSNGPAIKQIMPNIPTNPTTHLKVLVIGFPILCLLYPLCMHFAMNNSACALERMNH
jgi:hypothetical protein